jgi:hypothetical protein
LLFADKSAITVDTEYIEKALNIRTIPVGSYIKDNTKTFYHEDQLCTLLQTLSNNSEHKQQQQI